MDPGNVHEGAGLGDVGVCVGGRGVLRSESCLYPTVERLEPSVAALWVGTLGEGWHCEIFEDGCSAQVSQADRRVITSGEMCTSSSLVCLWDWGGRTQGCVEGVGSG